MFRHHNYWKIILISSIQISSNVVLTLWKFAFLKRRRRRKNQFDSSKILSIEVRSICSSSRHIILFLPHRSGFTLKYLYNCSTTSSTICNVRNNCNTLTAEFLRRTAATAAAQYESARNTCSPIHFSNCTETSRN